MPLKALFLVSNVQKSELALLPTACSVSAVVKPKLS